MRPFKPAPKKSFSPAEEVLFLRAARAYALRRFPNPDRNGCPTPDEIGAIARREIPLSNVEAQAEHIATCSPCLTEYLAVHETWKRRRRYRVAGLATAAVLILGVVGIIWLRSPAAPPKPASPPVAEVGKPSTPQQLATLDLRPFETNRGEPNRPAAAVPILAKANLRLTILLPAGSDEGNYQFQIRDEQGSPQVQGAGIAVIRNYTTTIETSIDLRPLNPGRFTWAMRRVDESTWRFYPLKVH